MSYHKFPSVSKAYQAWHKMPSHQFFHWLGFSIFTLIAFTYVFSVIYLFDLERESKNDYFQIHTVKAATTQGLVGYWNFDESQGTTAGDSSGSGNSGVLVNGPTWTTGKSGTGINFDPSPRRSKQWQDY